MVKPGSFGVFPIPFRDETCYSLLCRYAVRRGLYTSSQVCEDLFGHTEPLSGYMFKPFRLKDLQRWFQDWPSILTLEYGVSHSCYPFYAAFLKPADARKLNDCRVGSTLTSGEAKRINRECGFSKTHKKNLWYCMSCVREDIARHGETCWRRLPQIPGTAYCPVHGERLRESGVPFNEISYRLIPATYALMHAEEPEPEIGTVYEERYLALAKDISWLLESGFSIPDGEWMARSFLEATGKPLSQYYLHSVSLSPFRSNRFEDYLANRIIKDTGKGRIDGTVSRQIGSILSIEKAFGSLEAFIGN